MSESAQHTTRVNLGDRSYDVVTGADLLGSLGERARTLCGDATRAFVVIDDNLPKPLVQTAVDALRAAGFETATQQVRALESNKVLATVERILLGLTASRLERTDVVVALGGGIVGDAAGFAAAVYKRGVPVIQCPTSLLAMVDASVGGKTGVNLQSPDGLLKNLVGAFWQPTLVLADIHTLRSLSDRHLKAGLAECIKHALISAGVDDDLLAWTKGNLVKFRQRDEALLQELVARNVAVKARIVEEDEREATGRRALLNLGHTFAHAIETVPNLSPDGSPENAPLLHGEAVGLGLVAAAAAARQSGLISKDDEESVRVLIERAGMTTRLLGMPGDDRLLATMAHDKKAAGGRVRLVLPDGPSSARLMDNPARETIAAGLAAIRFNPLR